MSVGINRSHQCLDEVHAGSVQNSDDRPLSYQLIGRILVEAQSLHEGLGRIDQRDLNVLTIGLLGQSHGRQHSRIAGPNHANVYLLLGHKEPPYPLIDFQ